MDYKQSRLKTKTEFTFEEDELEYSMQDNSNHLNFEISYGNFPKRSQKYFERNEWLRNVGFIWLFLGIGLTALNFFQGNMRLSFWTWVGMICLAAYRYTWSEYTYFDTDEGRVLILKDSQSSAILDEIKTRRKKAFINWFENLEFESVDQASRSLEYMVKEKIFTRSEADIRLDSLISGKHLRLVSSNDGKPGQLH